MRRPVERSLYLTFVALFAQHCRAYSPSSASSHASPNVCAFEPRAQVSDACASYADLDQLNDRLHPYVRNLANNTDFFSYYRLNLYNKECPFWNDENGLCGNIACAVTTLDNEEDIPAIWRAEELSKLEGPKAHHPGKQQQRERTRPLMGELGDDVGESCVIEYDDECDERDYCVPEEESASGKGDYVSLAENKERFTGYSGEAAHQVWEAIYRENCFAKPLPASAEAKVSNDRSGFLNQAQASLDFKQVMRSNDRQKPDQAPALADFEDECLEKRVFYRVISGMHASISTHLCYDYLNQTTGEWGPNLECFKERLHGHPERISNLYFNYAFVLRAVGKLRNYVQDYTFCTGDPVQDAQTKRMITVLADAIPAGPQIFDESVMFLDPTLSDGLSLKEDFRNRFRNVSRIMDCVGCDKCRLWGKVQTAGFGTALKVLFEFDQDAPSSSSLLLRRTELVALINTLDKISHALKALEHFRVMLANEANTATDAKVLPRTAAGAVPSPALDFSDLEDLDDFDVPTSQRPEPTLGEMFKREVSVVFRAWVFVLKSWAELPYKIAVMISNEVLRFYDFWLGQPMRLRSWKFEFPSREEILKLRDEL